MQIVLLFVVLLISAPLILYASPIILYLVPLMLIGLAGSYLADAVHHRAPEV